MHDDEFLITFPVWFLAHPAMLSKGYIESNGPNGERATPFFTDNDLANRFNSLLDDSPYVLAMVKSPDLWLKVLETLPSKGFTHITIDQTGDRGMFFPIDEVIEITRGMM